MNKRFSNRWQMNGSLTVQDNPQYTPLDLAWRSRTSPIRPAWSSPTASARWRRYLFKLNGSYALPWDINASGNLNINDGDTADHHRSRVRATSTVASTPAARRRRSAYNTLTFQAAEHERFDAVKLLDLGFQKTFTFNGGKNRLKLILDVFNMFNINTITGYSQQQAQQLELQRADRHRAAAGLPRRRADHVLSARRLLTERPGHCPEPFFCTPRAGTRRGLEGTEKN